MSSSSSKQTLLLERISEFFNKHPRESFKSRQIAKRLGIRDEKEFQFLRGVLHGMVESQLLSYGRRYGYRRRIPSQGFVGILSIDRNGDGAVVLDRGAPQEIHIDSKYLGTALHGDKVEIALFARRNKKVREGMSGEVLRVLDRSRIRFVGIVKHSRNFFFVVPDDPAVKRDFYVARKDLNGARPGDKVIVQLESWESELQNPEGTILEVLGRAGDAKVEVESVLHEYHLPTRFPKEVEAETRRISSDVSEEEIARRLDLRGVISFTIDPEDAKDFDDALSIEQLNETNYRLGIHIADVSAYVAEGSALDREAYARGTSVYLPNRVIPMLPEKLSSDVCCLIPNDDRLAFSVIVEMTNTGRVMKYSIERTVIHSRRRFTYEEVEKILETGNGPHHVELQQLWSVASKLHKKRMSSGSIDFDSPEAKFKFDETGKPSEIWVKHRLKSHRLVEECMLLANKLVAERFGKVHKGGTIKPFLYRVHDAPNPEKLNELALFVSKFGYRLNLGQAVTSKSLQKLLHDVEGTPEENVINEVTLRSMAKAIYSEDNIGHYGLGFSFYTHFTSPIRRYPDLVVHRLIVEYERGTTPGYEKQLRSRLHLVGKWSSGRERVAMEAERDAVKVMQVEYMKRHVGDEFEGVISGVLHYGLFVELNDVLVEGRIHVRDLGDDYYLHDEKHYSLVGQRTGNAFRLGDIIQVKVVRVDMDRREIDFSCVPPKSMKKKRTS